MSDYVTLSRAGLSEFESKRLLADCGVDVVDEALVQSLDEALAEAERFGFPVVLKGCSSEALHKTEAGLVAVGLSTPEQVEEAFESIHGKNVTLDGVLVQPMVPGKREFIVGMTRDPSFGPSVIFGLGGIFTEALRDVVYRVAPFDKEEALRMCQEIEGRKLLGKFRDEPAVNMDALVNVLTAVGDLALSRPEVRELDLNPVKPWGDRVVAVDALVVLDEEREAS